MARMMMAASNTHTPKVCCPRCYFPWTAKGMMKHRKASQRAFEKRNLELE